MRFYYQVLTTPTADTPGTALSLCFPGKRYIIGQIAEGFQRACTENGTKLMTVSDVFISGRVGWDNTGGLIGLILTKADGVASHLAAQQEFLRAKEEKRVKLSGGKPSDANTEQEPVQQNLAIHGGRNLAHTLATARRFVFRKGLPLYTNEYDAESTSRKSRPDTSDAFEEPTWADENIKVWAMPINPSLLSPRSQSPRKRSLDEFREDNSGLFQVDRQSHDQILRQSVVAHMFNSNWSLDALEETRLADVNMPAQIFVRNPETKDLEKYTGPLPGGNEEVPELTVFVRKPWPGASIEKIPTTTKNEESLCYIIKNHDLRGKFDPKKANALKVKRGPDYGRLANGENVTAEDGTTVTPEMVLGPAKLGKGLAVMDLPTTKYVESLMNRPEWKSPSLIHNLEAFVWILGPGVGDHPRLREFVAMFPNSKHIVSSKDYCPNYLAMQSVAGSAIRLARLRPENFAVPLFDNNAGKNQRSPFEQAQPGLEITMEPDFKIQTSEVVPPFNASSILGTMPVTAERRAHIITKRLQHPSRQEKHQEWLKDLPGRDVEITTLGTGSSLPSKYRNVSSTLIHVPSQGYYLLDCGEGTLGQLKRLFNPQQLSDVLRNLRLVWVSHLHADHHLGTVSVLKAWYQENYPLGVPQSNEVEENIHKILEEKRLFVVSDGMMIEWLEEYASVEDFGFAKLVPLCANPYLEDGRVKTSLIYRHTRGDGSYPRREVPETKPALTELLFHKKGTSLAALLRKASGLSDLLTTYVAHCRGAMGVSLVFPNGFKVSFSGDCRPSRSFATIGKDSTVLIHEATFNDDMAGSALAKKHSTIGEAIQVGRDMRARAILLTHFSQRYQKVAYVETPQALVKDKKKDEAPPQPTKDEAKIQAEVQAQAETEADPINVENDTQEDLAAEIPAALLPPEPEPSKPAPSIVPIVTAFDHMRVRVGDMYTLEAYNPAVERLFEVLERASAQDQKKSREERNKESNANKSSKQQQKQVGWEKKMERKRAAQKASKEGKEDKEGMDKGVFPPSGHSPDAAGADSVSSLSRPQISVWDAPDSESGWSSSGSESDRDA
ncbi:hypothetical protein BDV06DRAFT_187261 [Aspergillus oleicola]